MIIAVIYGFIVLRYQLYIYVDIFRIFYRILDKVGSDFESLHRALHEILLLKWIFNDLE